MVGLVALCSCWHQTETGKLGILLYVLEEACQR